MQNLNFKIYFKPSFWLTIFTIPSFIILLVLGTWQVQRLGWKSDLISEYNNNFEKQPVTIDEVLKDSLNYKFRKVLVKGEFDNDKEIQLIGKTYEGNAGYHIITPFFLENNKIIYINRGWVPKKYIKKESRGFSLISGETEIIGLIRMPQKKGYFVPENEPDNGFWFTIKPNEFNKHLDISAEYSFYIDELTLDEKLKIPMPANGTIRVPNNHLQYAITWYSLAIGLIFVYFAWHRQNGFLKIN